MNFRIFTYDEIISNTINVFKMYSPSTKATDFAILTGAYLSKNKVGFWIDKANSKFPSYYSSNLNTIVVDDGKTNTIAIRPVINYLEIENDVRIIGPYKDYLDVTYGEYPQTVDTTEGVMLESLFQIGSLEKTGRKFYINDCESKTSEHLNLIPIEEYTLGKEKYVRVKCYNTNNCLLSNYENAIYGNYYWVKVEPLAFIVDLNTNLAFTKYAIISGINYSNLVYTNFNESLIKEFFNDGLTKSFEFKPKAQAKISTTKAKKNKSFSFDYKRVVEEDLIKLYIEADIPVFIHGRSSDGKSARVKELDPNLEIIYLRNATPEILNGKSVYNSEKNEMLDIPPTWYKRLIQKCNDDPNHIHILFLDELTNAIHSIQGMAFNIVLNKEVNGIWTLPDNCRIVAAGNESQDSLAATEMVEPLFNRFAHVYIETTANNWLKWALNSNTTYDPLPYYGPVENKPIHPSIYSYILCRGSKSLRTLYTGVEPNADPRKWEMASKLLYLTNKPYALRALVGKAITNDFVNFCKAETISLNDVLENNYNLSDLEQMDMDKKMMLVATLAMVDSDNVRRIRDFVKGLGKEMIALFDSLWLSLNPNKEYMLI